FGRHTCTSSYMLCPNTKFLTVSGHLLLALGVRGHAAIHRMELTTPQDKTWRKGKIPEPLTRARAHPQWSTLNSHAKPNQAERQEAIDQLADVVLQD
ncbi:DUF3482 domain-containing protein, partial [Pseudomonas amygdali]